MPSKDKGICITNKTFFPLFFTGRKLRSPGIGIEAAWLNNVFVAVLNVQNAVQQIRNKSQVEIGH